MVFTGEQQQNISDLLKQIGTEAQHTALGALCALAKQQASRSMINETIDRTALYAALQAGTPKARKNAARLLGALENPVDSAALIAAIKTEQVRFVRPSIILALGALGTPEAQHALDALDEPVAKDETEQKHVAEEKEALRRARARFLTVQPHTFTGFPAQRPILLQVPEGFGELLVEELSALFVAARVVDACTVSCSAQALDAILRARCFYELLVPLKRALPHSPEEIAAATKPQLLALLQGAHKEETPFFYRIACTQLQNRATFIHDLSAQMDDANLQNNPSAYEVELRLSSRPDGRFDAFAKLFTLPDQRFAYRKQAIPASIHPALAACIARYATRFAPNAKRILDPCCGSGTLLIEWGKLHPRAALTGVDIVPKHLSIAKENGAAAGLGMGLVQKDCTHFVAKTPYDLIVSNLPFGNRVGTHRSNEQLYRKLVQNIPDWLNQNGAAVLYTMEYALLRRLLLQSKALAIVDETRTEAGGLYPYVIAVKRN